MCIGLSVNWRPESTNHNYTFEVLIMSITVPAAKCVQGDLVLYSTSMKVGDLVAPQIYSVEKLDPKDSKNDGYQRVLNKARAKKLADYILRGQETRDAFLPTSILLATEKNIDQDESNNTITIVPDEIGPFNVVDGQHRLEGLRMAAEKDERVLNFQVSINIAINLDMISQMCHFLIVNTTQKSVDKAVEHQIYSQLTRSLDVADIPSLPKWIQTIVDRGDIHKAVKIVNYLSTEKNSPWLGKIQEANDDSKRRTITAGSFVKLIKTHILVANNPLTALQDFDKEKKILLNYWTAICNILDDGSDSVLFKYNGVITFSSFSIPFFLRLMASEKMSFTVETMENELRRCFESMEGEYAGVGHADWWRSGKGTSGGLNAGSLRKVVHEMANALHGKTMANDIEV